MLICSNNIIKIRIPKNINEILLCVFDVVYFLGRLTVGSDTTLDEDCAFHIKTHPALKEFPPHYRNGFKLLVSKQKIMYTCR